MAQLIIFMNFEAAKIRDTYGISRHHTWIFSIVPEYVNGINLSANSWELASLTSLCCLTSYICSKVPNCNSVERYHKYPWAKPRPILSRRPTHARRHRQDRRDPRPGRSAQWIMNDIYSVFVESNSINLFTIHRISYLVRWLCVSDGQADKLISLWLKHIWWWRCCEVQGGAQPSPAQPSPAQPGSPPPLHITQTISYLLAILLAWINLYLCLIKSSYTKT